MRPWWLSYVTCLVEKGSQKLYASHEKSCEQSCSPSKSPGWCNKHMQIVLLEQNEQLVSVSAHVGRINTWLHLYYVTNTTYVSSAISHIVTSGQRNCESLLNLSVDSENRTHISGVSIYIYICVYIRKISIEFVYQNISWNIEFECIFGTSAPTLTRFRSLQSSLGPY